MEAATAKTAFHPAIFKKDDRSLIGSISITNVVYGAFQSCNIGYELSEAETGKGT